MERYCGVLGAIAQKGRRYPDAAIVNQMHQQAMINILNSRHTLGLEALFMPRRHNEHDEDDWEDICRIPGSKFLSALVFPV